MEKSNIKIIHCPTTRCNKCIFSSISTCKQLVAFRESNVSTKVALFEPEKKLIHIGGTRDSCPTAPPWFTEGWETIFLGEENSIQNYSTDLLDVYVVSPYLAFFYYDTITNQINYRSVPLVKTPLELNLLNKLCMQTYQFIKIKSSSRTLLNDRILKTASDAFEHISKSIPEINKKTRQRIAKIIAHRTTAFGLLFPILLDDNIEELYLDRPESNLYFDHQSMGRCHTDITLSDETITRILTLLRSESNLHLDQRNPSLKTDLQILENRLRVAASIPPLSPDGLHLEIRRARTKPFTLLELIHNETMTLEVAATLLLAVASRFNITITGAPGVGKTTLLNALDMTTPRWWRKIYIEDTLESKLLKKHHQVRIRVDPIDEAEGKFKKSVEIIKSLHRSPDYLILGEIQTREHSHALFQAISAGLHTMQTCHSKSAASLISRWTLNHNINSSNIALMDIIVTLDRPVPGQSKRFVKEIVEIKKQLVDGLLIFSGLNTLYNRTISREQVTGWADDGAFLTQAHDIGLKNHFPAFNALVKLLTNELENEITPISVPLGEKLWYKVHPMKYSFT